MSPAPPHAAVDSSAIDSSIPIRGSKNGHDRLQWRPALHYVQDAATSEKILLFLVAFRILNALTIRTFFQPDEFFQSLEPAWQIAFGAHSGAWITWEWKHHLRSSIHPYLFAGVYWLANRLSAILNLSPAFHVELLLACPKVLQAIIAAVGDYYTWKLGEKVYGRGGSAAWAALAITICSPWQWFCSTRTLSNCLETTLSIAALNMWPWEWTCPAIDLKIRNGRSVYQLSRLRRCLLLSAVACVLRPTNILIWIFLASFALYKTENDQRLALFRGASFAGTFVLILTALLDRIYYQQWTFPPIRFLYLNIAQSLAVIYGVNDWHYYLTQGYPLLLTTFLPFALVGLYQAFRTTPTNETEALKTTIRTQLAAVSLFVPFVLSFISHKEVRFIYPILPILHILAARPFESFFFPSLHHSLPSTPTHPTITTPKSILLTTLLTLNILLAILTTHYHQPAPLTVLSFLRTQYEQHHLLPNLTIPDSQTNPPVMTIGFLMPCHSTPWRSHLIHAGIKAWALGCEPPISLNSTARSAYLDEADEFYADPSAFLKSQLKQPTRSKGAAVLDPKRGVQVKAWDVDEGAWDGVAGRKLWPEYLVFFEALEAVVKEGVVGEECWRGWNSWGHDDSRRRGDVIVWRLRT